ncbi:NHLP bacteriocin export ABC transporter permease/ATPase subunit [Marinibaculum pumilum]|uniref:NHLP bacteriocin export ABC transporter permease/ATPase subunit n=1 Tax=Marinibaculum pumilum TaxID=1766165 RepID=A0ABV7L8U1_9PROT
MPATAAALASLQDDLLAVETLCRDGGETLALADGPALWLVLEGRVELFALCRRTEARRFLAAIPEGGLLLAPPGPADAPVTLLAVPVGATRLLRALPAAAPQALTARSASLLAPAVEAWIDAAGATAWHFDGPARQRSRGVARLLRNPGWWEELVGFTTRAVTALAADFARAASAEAERLAALRDRVAEDRDRVFGRLAGILDERRREDLPVDGESPAMAACRRVAGALGHEFRLHYGPAPRNDRLAETAEVARAARLRARPVTLRGEWWREDLGPLVGFDGERDIPVALLPQRRGGYRAVLPDGRSRRIADPQAAAALSASAAALHPPLPDRPLRLWDLMRFGLSLGARDILLALAMGALAGGLAMAIPLATALIFNDLVPGSERGRLLQVCVALIAAGLGIAAFRLAADLALLRVEGRVASSLQAAVLDRVLRMPSSFFGGFSSADLTTRVLVVETIRKALTGAMVSLLLAGSFSFFSLLVMLHYEPRAALVAFGLLASLLGATIWAGLAQVKAILEGEALDANIFGLVQEVIGGIAKLRLAGAEERMFVRWARVFAEIRARMIRARKIVNNLTVFQAGYEVLALTCMFWLLATIDTEALSPGGFLAFVMAFASFLASGSQVSGALIAAFRVAPLAVRVRPVLATVPEADENKGDPGRLSGGIEINGVDFRYNSRGPLVLSGLSLSVRPGEFVAIVGASGSGKSTLVRLLLGFETPENGAIFYDGKDLQGLDLPALRRQIGVVLQTSRLMAGSIFENVRGVSEAGEADVWEALRQAGVEADVRAMPMGLHTVLTEGSAALSGGQIQRLLIARALIGRPRILLFDEATSALDNRTQSVVTESLDRLQVTRIVIAHRLSTIVNADRIHVLARGRVAERGTYAELIRRDGVFADLVRRQMI